MEYIVKVQRPLRALEPGGPERTEVLEGVVVRIKGVGIEMTDKDGIARFDISVAPGRGLGDRKLIRGPNIAAAQGKAPGLVEDEPDLLDGVIKLEGQFEAGFTAEFLPDVETILSP